MEEKNLECNNYQMLEIKNVTKIYKTKGGVDTRALDNVSISFANTGLVFLLGKSGSGKSTLLNVSGGLDEPTVGEIIVKGKSSKNFTGSDFDSYRNTFVGFIFQEYNILDEFNVEDNIALALELQGKPKDREKINSILRDVELEAFAKRKPNTLSGGQKQRIAIARALVKDPQIIMADEPTGALDSNTGKQVFDTLKKLSETRLVIVVSHDREFAEIYGDRIVELADGKIISDVTKTSVPAEALDENVSIIGGNTLSIKSGSKLTEKNIKTIQDFISNTPSDVIITNGKKEISSFKKINRMSESGATEKFEDTPENAIVHKDYTAEESKFIRSRLPAAKAVKIGASSLKLKPVRLVFTIFLSVVSFIMFGLFSTLMLYDGDSVLVNSFAQSEVEYLNLKKNYVQHNYVDKEHYTYLRNTSFTDSDVEYFHDNFSDSAFGYYAYNYGLSLSNVSIKRENADYYIPDILKFGILKDNNSLLGKITGEYPKDANEICISSYLFDVIRENNYYTVNFEDGTPVKGDWTEIVTKQDIIGKYLTIAYSGEQAFKVTGVFDSGKIPVRFDELKGRATTSAPDDLSTEFQTFIKEGLFSCAFFSESFFEEYSDIFSNMSNNVTLDIFDMTDAEFSILYAEGDYTYDEESGSVVWTDWSDNLSKTFFNSVLEFSKSGALDKYYFGGVSGDRQLAYDEVILSIDDVDKILKRSVIDYFISVSTLTDAKEKLAEAKQKYEAFDKDISIFHADVHSTMEWVEDENGGHYEITSTKYTYEERIAALARATEVISRLSPMEISMAFGSSESMTLKLVGVYAVKSPLIKISDEGVVFNDNFIKNEVDVQGGYVKGYTNFVPDAPLKYTGIMAAYDGTVAGMNKYAAILGERHATENDVAYTLDNILYTNVDFVNGFAEMMSIVFLWVGVVFAVFSALLLFNFISVSISGKKKEIGILRAVGARGIDVFKIFFSESGIIVGICTIIAIIGTFIVCSLINGVIMSEMKMAVTMFVFGPVSIALLVGIAVLVAVISTFLPVYLASRKKPVESIRAL